jgi:hypothetical protein
VEEIKSQARAYRARQDRRDGLRDFIVLLIALTMTIGFAIEKLL